MIRYIIEGDIYIANMTQHLTIKSPKDPYEVFTYLRKHNPSPFGGYFNYGEFQVVLRVAGAVSSDEKRPCDDQANQRNQKAGRCARKKMRLLSRSWQIRKKTRANF